MLHIRELRGLLPLLKNVGQSEHTLLTKAREQILRAAAVKFQFVDGFFLKSLGPPIDDRSSGVVVASVGFDSSWPIVTDEHEQLLASYRAKISVKENGDDKEKLTNFVAEFASKYCGRDLILNPMAAAQPTVVPPPTIVDVMMAATRRGRTVNEGGKKSRIERILCERLKSGHYALDVDCWLNFPLPAVVKLMQEKLETTVTLSLEDYRRTRLGPWTADNCLGPEILQSKEAPSLEVFMKVFRESRVMHRSVLERCFTPAAWAALCDARLITR